MESPRPTSPYEPQAQISQPAPVNSAPTSMSLSNTKTTQSSSLKHILLGLALLLTLGVVGLNAYFLGYLRVQNKHATSPAISANPSPTQTACTLEAMICPDGSTVGRTGPNCEFAACPAPSTEGWEELVTAQYSLKYPSTFTLNEQEDMNVLTATGPTQSEGTELFDGVALMFRWHDLQGSNLEEYVDQQISAIGDDGVTSLVSGKTTISVGEYQGFKYVIDGLGTYTQLFISSSESSSQALQIEYLLEDPTDQGFQVQLDQILMSLQLR